MGRFRNLRPSPSMMVAFVALFVAGAGSATAARLITGKQIRNSSITSADVRNGSLLRRDFRSAQLPRGPQGLPGTAGRPGRDGFGQVRYVSGQQSDPILGRANTVTCPAGFVPIGGDAYAIDALERIVPADIVDFFYPSGVPNAWAGVLVSGPPAGFDLLVIEAICANSSQASVSAAPAKSGGAKPAKPLR